MKQGIRITIDLKRDAIAEVVLNNLYANTQMQTSYSMILLAIDQGQPQTMGLKTILERFIAFRREVITRRTRFELRKARARLNIVEGLLVATSGGKDLLDHIIASIRASVDPDEGRWALMHLLSDELYTHPSFAALPRFQVTLARNGIAELLARAGAAEPLFKALSRSYEPGFSDEQARKILERLNLHH